jgi:hypothetical protein
VGCGCWVVVEREKSIDWLIDLSIDRAVWIYCVCMNGLGWWIDR